MSTVKTSCCVVGGGPAGMMAGLLLARQGVDVLVLEKHKDFLRDFRGDTIHPATLTLLDELGFLEDFLRLPHTKMKRVTMETASGPMTIADFRYFTGPHGYIVFMPQWDFLTFLAERAAAYPTFRLITNAEVTDLISEGKEVVGVRATTQEGPVEVRSQLVLGADGRHSTVRRAAGLPIVSKSPPMDVLWFRLERRPGEELPFFWRTSRSVLIAINRGSYWQVAFVIPPGAFDQVKAEGIGAFHQAVGAAAPALADEVRKIGDWNDVQLLSVRVDRLRRWFEPGVLCIGDAAHAMSPAGGVGINLALQDAVAAANILGPTFSGLGPVLSDLARVQRRRELPARVTQAFQVKVLRGLYPKASTSQQVMASPPSNSRGERLAVRLLPNVPGLAHVAGRFIGRGVRPEHIREAALATTSSSQSSF